MDVLFYAPQYRPNLSSMIRSAEFYGLKKVYIFDSNNLLLPPTQSKKARAEMAHMAKVWTAGAIEYVEIIKIEDVDAFLSNYSGRKVATILDEDAQHLNNFEFKLNDLIIFGSEKEGIPEHLIANVEETVYIPSLGKTPCLNVAVTFGIVIHHALKSSGIQ
ncbi:MAG: TrmH family RNA methyltransferase [Saprospiraceae bacterium]|nr:TrmH family RNA methyltransferase [Saprospiraceae bacterium]